MTALVASTSGSSSRGAPAASIGVRSPTGRACNSALSWRTGRVARCTTTTTTSAITATSTAWRHSVSISSWRASVWRSSRVSATWIRAMPRPWVPATGCSSTATRTASFG
jgi:hypothetical protein